MCRATNNNPNHQSRYVDVCYAYCIVVNAFVFLHRTPTDTMLVPTPTSSVNNGNYY